MKHRIPLVTLVGLLLVGVMVSTAQAAFPGQNGKIAFTLFQPDGSADVYTINPDGSGATNLTSNNPGNDVGVSWSPSGRKLAFGSVRAGSADIYLMNANGSGITKVPNTSGGVVGSPVWSPDGTKLAFTSGDPDIWVINVDGSGATNLTTTG